MVPFVFRIPKDLKKKLEELAKEDDRSLNSYLIQVLKKYVEEK